MPAILDCLFQVDEVRTLKLDKHRSTIQTLYGFVLSWQYPSAPQDIRSLMKDEKKCALIFSEVQFPASAFLCFSWFILAGCTSNDQSLFPKMHSFYWTCRKYFQLAIEIEQTERSAHRQMACTDCHFFLFLLKMGDLDQFTKMLSLLIENNYESFEYWDEFQLGMDSLEFSLNKIPNGLKKLKIKELYEKFKQGYYKYIENVKSSYLETLTKADVLSLRKARKFLTSVMKYNNDLFWEKFGNGLPLLEKIECIWTTSVREIAEGCFDLFSAVIIYSRMHLAWMKSTKRISKEKALKIEQKINKKMQLYQGISQLRNQLLYSLNTKNRNEHM